MRFSIREVGLYERDVRLRLPLRVGGLVLSTLPQAFVQATIETENGKQGIGAAAELLVPRWFDPDASLGAEQNLDQLRVSLFMARDSYLAAEPNTAFGHSIDNYGPQIAMSAVQGMNGLVAGYGPALIDRAVLDALCRALGVSFQRAIERNVPGISAPGWQADLMAFDMESFLEVLSPGKEIALRHTIAAGDALTGAELESRAGDGLPETLEEVLAAYGPRAFKVELGGDQKADLERLAAIAALLERSPQPYSLTLDGNERYDGAEALGALWRAMRADPRLKRLAASVACIEQPLKRQHALGVDVSELAEEKALAIDESDDSLEAFPRARRLGYTGVASRTCKGFYKSILNAARCLLWNREEGGSRYFVTGEDLALPAGLGVQQHLALASLLGLKHVELNGHHYANGMAGLPEAEQKEFLEKHADLYEQSHGAVRLRIRDGAVQIGSLGCTGFASAAMPDWESMHPMEMK